MCVLSLLAQSFAVRLCLCVCMCVYGFVFFWDVEGGMYMFGCCTCLTQIFSLFRARFAAYSSNYASNTVHELCVWVWF